MAIGDGDVIRVTAVLKRATVDDVMNVFYARLVAGGGASQSALRGDLAAWMEDVYDGLQPGIVDDVTFDEIQLFNMTDGTPEPTESWPTLTVGGSTGDPLPEGVAALVIARTGLSRVIGKKYFGLFSEAAATDGLWTAPTMALFATAGADWITPFTGASLATWDPVVWRRVAMTHAAFTEAVTTNVPAYQRRRKRGVGS